MSKSNDRIQEVKEGISNLFEIRDLGEIKYYLGIEINKVNGIYNLNQQKYIKQLLNKYKMDDAKISKIPIDVSYGKSSQEVELQNNDGYQELIGSLLYLAINTRPDISTAVCILAQKTSKPSKEDWNELKRVLKYLKGTANLKLFLGNFEERQELLGYADANYAENRIDRKSNSGFIFKLNGGTISWKCSKQKTVSLSSTEAEFVALCEAVKEALWLQNLLADINRVQTIRTTIYEDNQSCIKMIENQKISNRSKHIDVKFHFIRDIIKGGKIQIEYCSTNEMLADLLTKPLSNIRFGTLRDNLNLQN